MQIEVSSLGQSLDRFRAVWRKAEADGKVDPVEALGFETIEELSKTLSPGRWALLDHLQHAGPIGLRELARKMDRDAANVQRDVARLKELGLIEDHPEGGIWVPFEEIRIHAVMRRVA